MPSGNRRAVRHVAGWGLLILGVAGLLLPVLQGWLFIALGAMLLAPDVRIFARVLDWIEKRFPALRAPLHRARARFGHHDRTPGPEGH
jgi:uncharacterized membrane protein YbaN (DUF454 family)